MTDHDGGGGGDYRGGGGGDPYHSSADLLTPTILDRVNRLAEQNRILHQALLDLNSLSKTHLAVLVQLNSICESHRRHLNNLDAAVYQLTQNPLLRFMHRWKLGGRDTTGSDPAYSGQKAGGR